MEWSPWMEIGVGRVGEGKGGAAEEGVGDGGGECFVRAHVCVG